MYIANIEISKKTFILAGLIVLVGFAFFVFIQPLWSKVSVVAQEVKALDGQLLSVRAAIKSGKDLNRSRRPISREEISTAINEIMETGASFEIDFFSTNPQNIQKAQDAQYPVLPIQLELQSQYKNFGLFLGALENLKESIVTVKQFDIQRKPTILPEIYVNLIVEIHLKEGESG